MDLKPGTLVICNRVQPAVTGAKCVWTLNLPSTPTINGDRLTATNGAYQFDAVRLSPTDPTSRVVSWPSADPDISAGTRVDVEDIDGAGSVFLNVLSTDRAFNVAVRSDATNLTGTLIRLADGSSALVRLAPPAVAAPWRFTAKRCKSSPTSRYRRRS